MQALALSRMVLIHLVTDLQDSPFYLRSKIYTQAAFRLNQAQRTPIVILCTVLWSTIGFSNVLPWHSLNCTASHAQYKCKHRTNIWRETHRLMLVNI